MRRALVTHSLPVLLSLCAFAAPAHAGLFDFLFQSQAPRESAAPIEPGFGDGSFSEAPAVPRRRPAARPHPRVTAMNKDSKDLKLPEGTSTEALRKDHTLRDGDAVMTENGLLVYTGSAHGEKQFAPLAETKGLSEAEQAKLSEMNVQYAAVEAKSQEPAAATPDDQVVTGRSSSADANPAWKWVRDPKGNLVRYVGP